jgi:predicted transport protein
MFEFLGVHFVASEYSTGKTHGGRIDSLGLDENGYPVIVEYKRATNENVINQGLFYLDWLMDHKGEYKLLVLEKLGKKAAEGIEWSNPRLLCIAGDFTKYDGHAVQQINRNIDLIRYKRYGDDLLLLELVNATSAERRSEKAEQPSKGPYKSVGEYLENADKELRDLFEQVKAYCLAKGDDVQEKELKNYFAYKRIKNFACVEVHNQKKQLTIFVKADPKTVGLEKGFTRDVSDLGHYGTGDLEITISTMTEFEKAKVFLDLSYEAS